MTLDVPEGAATAFAGLAFHVQNSRNYYALRFSGSGVVQMVRVVEGQQTQFSQSRDSLFTFLRQHPYRLRVIAHEDHRFTGELYDAATGKLLWSEEATDAQRSFTEGRAGVVSFSKEEVSADEFTVEVR